jgi:Spy/CpxP family protein refolding chaperone
MTQSLKRVALGVAAVAVLFGITAGVYAAAQPQNTNQNPPPFSGHGPRGFAGRGGPGGPMSFLPMLGRLQLTDAQRAQLKTIADAHRDEWTQLADRARSAHEALNAAVMADPVDEASIRQKSTDVAAVEADIAVARAHARSEAFQVLTADQKNQLKEMRSRARDHARQMIERMRERLGL